MRLISAKLISMELISVRLILVGLISIMLISIMLISVELISVELNLIGRWYAQRKTLLLAIRNAEIISSSNLRSQRMLLDLLLPPESAVARKQGCSVLLI